MRPLLRFAFMCAVAMSLSVAAPRVAHACVWKLADSYSPFPPCETDDNNTRRRLSQANIKIAQKLGVIAAKAQMVAGEIRGWADAVGAAKGYERSLTRLYGSVTANPLGPLAATYTVSGLPINFTVAQDGKLTSNFRPSDFRQYADSLEHALLDSGGVTTFYADWIDPRKSLAKQTARQTMTRLTSELNELADYHTRSQLLNREIKKTAALAANRYAKTEETDGLAEARITQMINATNRLKVGAVRLNQGAIVKKLDAVTMAAEMNREQARYVGRLSAGVFVH